MSDIVWILIIAAAYFLIIRPMFQGASNSARTGQNINSNKDQKPSRPKGKDDKGDDYVDYEEIK